MQQQETIDYLTLDQGYPTPTNKAYFERPIVLNKAHELAGAILGSINDFHSIKNGFPLTSMHNYRVNVHTDKESESTSPQLETTTFADIETTITISNLDTKSSAMIRYLTRDQNFQLLFFKNCKLNEDNVLTACTEVFKAESHKQFLVMPFILEFIKNYLETSLFEPENITSSITFH
jgi:hypothetical protein